MCCCCPSGGGDLGKKESIMEKDHCLPNHLMQFLQNNFFLFSLMNMIAKESIDKNFQGTLLGLCSILILLAS